MLEKMTGEQVAVTGQSSESEAGSSQGWDLATHLCSSIMGAGENGSNLVAMIV